MERQNISSRESGTENKTVRLVDAPARFLDADDLARLVELTGSGAKALEALSHPDPAMLVAIRRMLIAEGRGDAWARLEEEIYAQVEKMISAFKTLGAESRIVAFGICSATALRQAIPRELWEGLAFDFQAGTARPINGSVLTYTFIEIEEIGPETADDRVARFVSWLERRVVKQGVEVKKVLEQAAKAEFAAAFRVRIFNEAYKKGYGHSRSRPAQLSR